MTLVSIFIVILQLAHVVSNVLAKDVVTVNFSIEFIGFVIIAWETLVAGTERNI